MIANLISLSRPALAVAFLRYGGDPPIAVAILSAAGISDWLDGWTAKRLGQESRLGRVLDPICDRLFVIPVLISLITFYGLAPWKLTVLVVRDVATTLGGLAVWILRPDQLGALQPHLSGKVVTSLQFWCVVHVVTALPRFEVALTAVAITTLWALGDYSAQFRRVLGASKSVSTP